MDSFATILKVIKDYMGTGFVTVLFLIALAYAAIFEKDRVKRCFFVYMPAMMIPVFLCPLFFKIYGLFSEGVTYYRILWLIPEIPVIAYSMSHLVMSFKGKARVFCVFLCTLLVIFCGKLMYLDTYMIPADNIYHMPKYVVDICDALHVDGREVQVLVPDEMQQFVRQYDPCICIPYGREYMMGLTLESDEIRDAMSENPRDPEKIGRLCVYRYVHYIVVPESMRFEGSLVYYDEYMTIDGYVIYKNMYLDTDV